MNNPDARDWFVTDLRVGTVSYYSAAIDAGYYGVADEDGRAFRSA